MALSGVGSLGEDNRPLWNLKPNAAGAGHWIIFGPSPLLGFISSLDFSSSPTGKDRW